MKIVIYFRNELLLKDKKVAKMLQEIEADGHKLMYVKHNEKKVNLDGVDRILSIGGDGTFLSAASLIADSGVPILGVNLGRVGFLSENSPELVLESLRTGYYSIENRQILKIKGAPTTPDFDWPYALNEVAVYRGGSSILGVDVIADGYTLPTYWADGLLISTSAGSTAYSLSAGGPIVMPDAKVLILTPIAPHNLNVRPLIFPDTTKITLKIKSREGRAYFSADNRSCEIKEDDVITISLARFSLKRIRPDKSHFITALSEKLFWGEDMRNYENRYDV